MLTAAMLTDLNPFVYSRPVPPDDVIDRDDETTKLLAAAVGGHYVRLFAPRKFGKTSLVQLVLRDAERSEGMVPVLVDFYGVLSLADVAVRIERAYAGHLRGRLRSRIDEFLQSTGLGLSLGVAGLSATLQLDPRIDPLPALHALLDLPLQLGSDGGRRALIVFDEFQDVSKAAGVDAIIRSHIQLQGEVASYVFCGSQPTLMRELFERRDRPLYGQAVPFQLGRLRDQDIAVYVVERFRGTGREVGDGLGPLLAAAEGHPQRAMLLAYRLWERVERGGRAGHEAWRAAADDALTELQPELDARWQRLSTVEQKTLRAVIAGRGSPYRTAVLQRLGLPKASAQRAVASLIAQCEVESRDASGYGLVDPLFARWIGALADPP